MNLLKQLRFGGVFGGVTGPSSIMAIESKGVVVRPSGFEPPTFCSGGKPFHTALLLFSIACRPSRVNSKSESSVRARKLVI